MRALLLAAGLQCASSLAPSFATVPRRGNNLQPLRSTVDKQAESSTDNYTGRQVPYFMDETEPIKDTINPLSEMQSFDLATESSSTESTSLLQSILSKIGHIDYETRLISPHEYQSKQQPTLFSNIEYATLTNEQSNTTVVVARHSPKSVASSAALLCGTALGSGLIFLPHSTLQAGYVPALPATFIAFGYSTVSALLTAELLLNRCGETGRVRNVGLLELYQEYLGEIGSKAATVGFVGVSYVIMGVYFSQGGDLLSMLTTAAMQSEASDALQSSLLQSSIVSRTIFAAGTGLFLATASKFGQVQRVMANILVPLTLVAFAAAIITALPTADFASLTASANQHPELVLNAFPVLFMSWASHAVVPRVVYDLEGDEGKIKQAIWGGSSTALMVYLIWNAVILGNVLGGGDVTQTIKDPIGVLQSIRPQISTSITIVSGLAVTTSLIGIILGFVNEFYDAIGALPSQSYGPKTDNKWQVALLTLTPSVIFSILLGYYQPDLDRSQVMEYTGAFGASTLFLILPALMVWQNRYGEDARPLTVKPMFPLGKITLGSLYKAAGTLIVEQGLEKLGLFEFVSEHFLKGGDTIL